jgi:hypothetical protein
MAFFQFINFIKMSTTNYKGNLKMNGTIYDEIKKNGDSKKRQKLKFAMAIISTNLLVIFLFLSFQHNDPAPIPQSLSPKKIHSGFKMLVIPLTLLIDTRLQEIEIPVTLISKSKKIIIAKAYLHEAIPTNPKDQENLSRFKIEIPEAQLLELSAEGPEVLIAIPEIPIRTSHKKNINNRESPYEINI